MLTWNLSDCTMRCSASTKKLRSIGYSFSSHSYFTCSMSRERFSWILTDIYKHTTAIRGIVTVVTYPETRQNLSNKRSAIKTAASLSRLSAMSCISKWKIRSRPSKQIRWPKASRD